jgi:potassium uptake TrkH family protein
VTTAPGRTRRVGPGRHSVRRAATGLADRGLTFVTNPVRIVPLGFAGLIALGTALLLLPASSGEEAPESGVPFTTAVFTATSAVCVTGLNVVPDTATYWSTFGQGVILALIQTGGLGIATITVLLALVVARRLGIGTRLAAAAGTGAVDLGDVRRLVVGIVRIFLVVQAAIAVVLTLRFVTGYDEPPLRAAWLGLFHSVSAFNNAGFALFGDSLIGFARDEWITVPIMVAIILGGLGFPVILEVLRRGRVRMWSINTKITLITTGLLLVGGTLVMIAVEAGNRATVGAGSPVDGFWAAVFMSVSARTAGYNTVNYADVSDAGLLATTTLMFIGGASASTAGGIKVATLAVLVLAVFAEARGDSDTEAFGRRIDTATLRQALAVTSLYLGQVIVATLLLLELSEERLADALFEVVSATGTVGLSTGTTLRIEEPAQWVLIGCMFLGRIGPAALAAALALRERPKLYRLPRGRPLIG